MNLPTVFETCQPREGVLNSTIADADFAADLAKVIRGTASDDYKIPARFFANAYPTTRLKNPCHVLSALRVLLTSPPPKSVRAHQR
jgi:predicted AAA+ superfamily ATPase